MKDLKNELMKCGRKIVCGFEWCVDVVSLIFEIALRVIIPEEARMKVRKCIGGMFWGAVTVAAFLVLYAVMGVRHMAGLETEEPPAFI